MYVEANYHILPGCSESLSLYFAPCCISFEAAVHLFSSVTLLTSVNMFNDNAKVVKMRDGDKSIFSVSQRESQEHNEECGERRPNSLASPAQHQIVLGALRFGIEFFFFSFAPAVQ